MWDGEREKQFGFLDFLQSRAVPCFSPLIILVLLLLVAKGVDWALEN